MSRITSFVASLVAVAVLAPFVSFSGDLSTADRATRTAAMPSVETLLAPPSELIVIKVPAKDLSRCVATLEQVFFSPVEGGEVQSASLSPEQIGPTVRCEVE